MPCQEYFNLNSMSSNGQDYCSPERLQESLHAGQTVLLLDCRNQADFNRSRIKGAINVTLPCLMLRRLKKGNLNISCAIQNNEAKEKFNRLWKTHLVVLYDECSTDPTSNPSSVINLLLKKLKQDGSRANFLLGGFSTFEERCPEQCVRHETSDNSIFGLCNLKISDDSAYGSESSCDSVNSPSTLSPFPVEVVSHLYLGNAKNSADLNQLKKYGIKYILNVTPNVPNMFETDKSFKYMQIPISDHWSQNLSVHFPEAIAFIDEARLNNNGVLVHCLAGISRSVTVTVAYLMSKNHMSLNEAYDYVKKCKPNISPNFNFMGQLLDFEKTVMNQNVECACENSTNCHCHEQSHNLLTQSSPEESPSYSEVDVRPA